MQIRLLGGLGVIDKERSLTIGGPKERRVLAVLAIHANRAVSEDQILEVVWGEAPPRTALKTLQGYVSRLRKILTAGSGDFAIEARAPGYILRVPPGGTDVAVAEDLATRVRQSAADGDAVAVVELASEALALWRGPSLSEFAGEPFAQPEAHRLDELRLGLVEERVEAELTCGHHATLVGELEALSGAHPTRERLWAQRMMALYRSGRQAEALRAYQELRRYLNDELGLEPTGALQQLEHAILIQDPLLEAPTTPGRDSTTVAGPLPEGVVTFLLTDIEGSTGFWDADPDAMARALELHDNHIAAAVSASGGALIKAKGEGDSTVSVFRSPSEAAIAAIKAQQDLDSTSWPSALPVRVRMSLHTGEAQLREGDYFGIALNRAARLRQLARGGQTLVSAVTAELIRDKLPEDAGLVDLGLHELRGIRRMEHVFQLWSSRGQPTSLGIAGTPTQKRPARIAANEGPLFVGRERELAELDVALEAALGGAPQLAVVIGEAGIGKSRLVQQFGRRAVERGARVLIGRCQQHLEVPYLPFVGALFPVLQGEGSELVARLAGPGPDRPQPERPGDDVLLWSAVADATLRLARQRPTVLVVEDFHWADQATVDLLTHLVMAMANASLAGAVSLLVVTTTRPDVEGRRAEALHRIRREELCRSFTLGGLPPADVEQLAKALGLRGARRRLMAMLVETTRGNPLFLESVIGQLLDEEQDYRTLTQWSPSVPVEIDEAIDQRVGRVSEECRRLLVLAAHFGRPFQAEDLAAAGGGPLDAVVRDLDEAVSARLIVPADEQDFRFTHDLYARALYSRTTPARRRATHAAIARSMLEAGAAELDRRLLEITHHIVEAGVVADPAWAFDPCQAGAERAQSLSAWAEAFRAFAALTAMGERLGLGPARQAELEMWAGRTAGHSLDPRASDHFSRAATAFRAAQDRRGNATAMLELSRHRLLAATPGQLVDVQPLVHALEGLGDAEPDLRAQILAVLAMIAFTRLEPDRSEALAGQALELAEPLGDHDTMSRAHAWRGIAAWIRLDLHEARDRLETSLDHARRLENGFATEGISLTRLALIYFALGRLDDAESTARAGDAAARASGDIVNRTHALACLIGGAVARGQFDAADRAAGEATELLRFVEYHQPRWLVVLPEVSGQLWRGHWAEASTTLDAWSEADPSSVSDFAFAPVLWAARALSRLYAGDADAVRRSMEAHAPNWLQAPPLSMGFVQQAAALVELSDLAGVEVPRERLLRRLAAAHERGMVFTDGLVFLVPRVLGLAAALNGRVDEAETHLREAASTATRLGSRPELARCQLDLARLCFRRAEDGDKERAARHARQAASMFAELGMGPFEQQAAVVLAGAGLG